MLRHLFSDPYVCTIVITHAIYSINIVYTKYDASGRFQFINIVFSLNLSVQGDTYMNVGVQLCNMYGQ